MRGLKVSLFDFFWFLLLLMSLIPMFKQQKIEVLRLKIIRDFEMKRKSRLITMIHRQETFSFLGLPVSRYINIEDSEQILRAIRLTPDDMPIDLVLHTPGGLVLAAEQIAEALRKHPAKVTVFIPHYAMSGGTLIALAADEIVMDENAVAGPVDPQLGEYPAASILKVVEQKGPDKVEDRTLIMADIAKKALAQVENTVVELLSDKMDLEKAREVAKLLSQGTWTHDYPISAQQLKELGLPVSTDLPREIYELMDLYPQPQGRRPSVQYIPLPYGKNDLPK
ncbi:SDH family Clp fold serine proteinase [Carboxydothermus ferrireducens]|uniref:SDH family Clp fold serine proteinase n=1 Tax=Carboxydothermus ferrireducens TaxID=54265 RepID=UPI0009FD6468|nr:ATP-dependent Clp protease proteolytic subunit [Carboxydothermus ferrireducens]